MATLDEVAEKFALDNVFSERPKGDTLDKLELVVGTEDYYNEYTVWEPYENMPNNDLMQIIYDTAWAFKNYYREVTE